MEAVRSLRSVGDRLALVVADGYDVSKLEELVGVIANPLAAADSLGSPDESRHFGYDSDSNRVSFNEKVTTVNFVIYNNIMFYFFFFALLY